MIKRIIYKLQQYSGVAGVLILWTGITVAMRRTGLGLIDPRPISHLGVDPVSAKLFTASLLISTFLFVIFGYYVKRAFYITNGFLAYLLIGQVGQAIVALAPYGDKNGYRLLHTIAAFTLAFSLPLLMRQFAASQIGSRHHHVYVGLLRLEQATFVVGIGLFVFAKGIAPLGQALPATGYHLWIIVITYLSIHADRKYAQLPG